jgi:hypothetical protein
MASRRLERWLVSKRGDESGVENCTLSIGGPGGCGDGPGGCKAKKREMRGRAEQARIGRCLRRSCVRACSCA